jgi:tetratricopeptide (TPR) repeat protein
LAEHFIASESYEKGAEYSRLAYRKAAKANSYYDATVHAKRRVFCIEKQPQTGDWLQKRIDARTVLGILLTQTMHYPEAKEAIDPILDAAIKTNYRKRLGQIYTTLGSYYTSVEEDLPRAFTSLDEALEISREVKDVVSELYTNFWLSVFLCLDCNFAKALVHYQRNFDVCEELKLPWSISAMKAIIATFCYFFQGKFNQQHEMSSDSVRIAEEMGDTFLKVAAYTSHGRSLYGKGLFEEAEQHLLKAVEFSGRFEIITWHTQAHFGLAEIYHDTKEYPKSREHYEKGLEILERNQQHPSWVHMFNTGVIRSKVMYDEKDIDFDALYNHARNNRYKALDGTFARYIGEILLNIDDQHMPEAEHWIQKGIETDERNGLRFSLALGYALYAEWCKRKGDRLKAQENQGKAIEIYRECGADGWVTMVEKELAALS